MLRTDLLLTKDQELSMNTFLSCVIEKTNRFESAYERGFGKTTILNELALHLQSIGYKVILYLPVGHEKHHDGFYAEGILTSLSDLRGVLGDMVVIADEVKYGEMRYRSEILEYCESKGIPIVGYAQFF